VLSGALRHGDRIDRIDSQDLHQWDKDVEILHQCYTVNIVNLLSGIVDEECSAVGIFVGRNERRLDLPVLGGPIVPGEDAETGPQAWH